MHAVRYSQTRCSHLSLADCRTQTVDCCPLLVFRYWFLATFSLGRCRVLDICSTMHFTLMLAVPLKRSAVLHSHIASCFALLTACCPVLLSGSLLLDVFSFLIIRCSILFTLYSLLAAYRLSLLRVSLRAAAALCLLLAA